MKHYRDPCIHCGLAMADFPVGACEGDPTKAIPIAYASLGIRHDKVEHFRVRFSDNRVEDRWSHISEMAHYYHFGHSEELKHPPKYDARLKLDGHLIEQTEKSSAASLHREAISEPPCGAAVTPHPVAPNTQEEGT